MPGLKFAFGGPYHDLTMSYWNLPLNSGVDLSGQLQCFFGDPWVEWVGLGSSAPGTDLADGTSDTEQARLPEGVFGNSEGGTAFGGA